MNIIFFVSTSANSSLSQFPNLGLIVLYCFNISTTKIEAPMYFENELYSNYLSVQPIWLSNAQNSGVYL